MALALSSRWAVLLISLGIVLADQVSKHCIRTHLEVGAQVPVIPGCFNLSHVLNTGAAWGLLQGLGPWLIVFSMAVLLILLSTHRVMMRHSRVALAATGLLFGGITGNLIDRIRLGHVVDFLDFYWKSWHFPSFNVADASICLGVGLFLLTQRSASPCRGDHKHEIAGSADHKREAVNQRSVP